LPRRVSSAPGVPDPRSLTPRPVRSLTVSLVARRHGVAPSTAWPNYFLDEHSATAGPTQRSPRPSEPSQPLSSAWAGLPPDDPRGGLVAHFPLSAFSAARRLRIYAAISLRAVAGLGGLKVGALTASPGRRNGAALTRSPSTYSHSASTSGSRVLRLRRSIRSKASRRSIIAAYRACSLSGSCSSASASHVALSISAG